MTAAQALPKAAPAHVDDVPEDMRFPSGLEPTAIKHQMDAVRADIHRWKHINEPRTRLRFGEGAMEPRVYRAGLQARLSAYHTLHALWRAQQHGGTPQ